MKSLYFFLAFGVSSAWANGPFYYENEQNVLATGQHMAASLYKVDIDVDGDTDILSGGENSVTLYRRGLESFESETIINEHGSWKIISTDDFDNDGKIDIIAHKVDRQTGDGVVSILLKSDNLFMPSLEVGDAVTEAITGDIDQDGDLDIITYSKALRRLYLYINEKKKFSKVLLFEGEMSSKTLTTLSSTKGREIVFVDQSDYLPKSISYRQNKISLRTLLSRPVNDSLLYIRDLNGDGHEDLILWERSLLRVGSKLMVFTGANGVFSKASVNLPVKVSSGDGGGLYFSDLRGNGTIQIIASGGYTQGLELLFCTPELRFSSFLLEGRGGNRTMSVITDDLNSDGIKDIIGVDLFSGAIFTYHSK